MRAVGIQEGSGNIYDLFVSPDQHQPGLGGHYRYFHRLQVFLVGIFQELIHVFRIHHHCHALLGFGDGDLCSVQTGVLLRNLVQINMQTVRQLTDGYRNAARAEIITFLDQFAYLRTAEHSLDLSLGRRVSFLNLRAANLNGGLCVYLGGTSGAPDAIPAGPAPQQDDDISRI